ncbi:MAG: PRC-barrel domain-containing protein [Usitatibacteraceae bacterium]
MTISSPSAQTSAHASTPTNTYQTAFAGFAVKSTSIVGTKVFNRQSEHAGKVEEVVINVLDGNVAYLVVSFGGLFGMGEKLYAVPWKALYYDHELHAYLLNVPKEKIELAPGFEKEVWPLFTDERWNRSVHDHYGLAPFWVA